MADDDNGEAPPKHPAALTPRGRAWEMLKHVAVKTLKYAVIVGIVGAVLFALIPAGFLGPVASVASMFSHSAAAAAVQPIASAALAGAKYFALAGAALGAAVGIHGASEAADEAQERRILDYDRREIHQERMEALAMRRKQHVAMTRHLDARGHMSGLPRRITGQQQIPN